MTEWFAARHILCFMLFSGFTIVFLLRVTLNMAIVGMVASSANISASESPHSECHNADFNNTSDPNLYKVEVGEFDWDEFQQGVVLSAFFWGYIVSQVPGGRLAELYGIKIVFGYAVLLEGLLSCMLPYATKLHWLLLLVIRALQGVAQGVTCPALSATVVRWVPLRERAIFVSLTVQGCSVGPVVAMPLCGWILTNYGWEAVFYVSGLMSVVWYIAWVYLVYDCPAEHPRISKAEASYLQDTLDDYTSNLDVPVPWGKIFSSSQFWVGVVAFVGSDWGFHTFYTFSPKYIKDRLGFDIQQSGILSSLPFLCQYIFGTIFGAIADCSLTRYGVKLKHIRKISVAISHLMPALGVVLLTWTGCNVALSVVVLTASVAMLGALTSGYFQNNMDIAPNYAGSLTGISNTFGTFTGIICAPVAGAVLNQYGTIEGWKVIFYITAAVYVVTSVPYLIWATAEVQPWNYSEPVHTTDNESDSRQLESLIVSNQTDTTVTCNNLIFDS